MIVNELIADLQERVRKDPLLGTCEAVVDWDHGYGYVPHDPANIEEVWEHKQWILVVGRT